MTINGRSPAPARVAAIGDHYGLPIGAPEEPGRGDDEDDDD